MPIILEPNDPKAEEMEMFYSEVYPYKDGYFSNWGEFLDWWVSGMEIVTEPKYVNGTYSRQIKIDAEWIIEAACEDLHEDAEETISKEDIDELQAFLDAWCVRQTGTRTYYMDPNCLVRIPWEWSAL
jgi:hypothetical protein